MSTELRSATAASLVLTGAAAVATVVVTPALAPSSARMPQAVAVVAVVLAVALIVLRIPIRAGALSLGALTLVVGTWANSTSGPDLLRGLAIAAAPLTVALAALGLAWPRRGRPALLAVALTAVGGVVAGPVRALFDDPFLEASCRGCRRSAIAIFADPDVAVALVVAGFAGICCGTIVATVLSPSVARIALGVVAAAAIAGAGTSDATLSETLLSVAAAGIAVVSAIVTVADNLRVRRRLAQWSAVPALDGELVERLRASLGDPGLGIAFVIPGATQRLLVTADGEPAPGPRSDQVVTPIELAGEVVAHLHSSPTAIDQRRESVLSPQLLVAIEARQLTAALAARVRDLQASRSRVVRRADEERRRLERDLHDGAQQHVLALGFDLRTLLVSERDPELVGVLERCRAETALALDELREVAHGVYPPLLASGGLAPALAALGRGTQSAIRVGELPGRMPTSVERCAYLLVADLAARGAGPLEVSSALVGEQFVLAISGADEPAPLIAERVAALGGSLTSHAGSLRMELPCV